MAGVKSCRFCLHPHMVCGCSQISAWSHTSTRQTPATVTTARSHESMSVNASIMHPPPGLLPQGAAAPTSTYSRALALDQAPPTHMRGVSRPPLPGAGYPSVDPCQMAHNPRMRPRSGRSTQCPLKRSQELPINNKYRPQFLPPIPLGLGEEPSLK